MQSEIDILPEGEQVKLVIGCPNCGHLIPDVQRSKAGKAGGRSRWANVSKADRVKAAQKMAAARWSKKQVAP